MFRYIAFAWNTKSLQETLRATQLSARLDSEVSGWYSVLSSPGIAVYCAGSQIAASRAVRLRDSQGVVLGTLFRRSDGESTYARAVVEIDTNDTTRIVETAGRHLVDAYWGRYVAFLHEKESGSLWILRDPTGGLPCFNTSLDGVQIFAARVQDCCEISTVTFEINWEYIGARVLNPYLQTRKTGLRDVAELPPGACLEMSNGKLQETSYWDPLRVAASSIAEDVSEAATRLRRVVTASVHAWASCYDAILVKLSGGLDSAIVLGCLASAPKRPNTICVNDYSEGADTDERHFARLAAGLAGCTLVERRRDPSIDLDRTFTFRRASAPRTSHAWIQTLPTNEESALRNSASAVFMGNGGDHLFLTGPGHWPVADYLYRRGPRLRALRIARDASCLEPPARCQSVWSLLRLGIRLGLVARRKRELLAEHIDYSGMIMVNAEVIDAYRRTQRAWLPPWFHGLHDLPPGKVAQAYRLSFSQPFYAMSIDQPELLEPVNPLLSQPVIELCLQIPTYILMSEGRDRGAARKAFADVVPREIVERRTKGGVDTHAVTIVLRNAKFLREFLLEGELARQKMLNRSALDHILGGNHEGLTAGTFPILDLLHVEAWVRAWSGRQVREVPARSMAATTRQN